MTVDGRLFHELMTLLENVCRRENLVASPFALALSKRPFSSIFMKPFMILYIVTMSVRFRRLARDGNFKYLSRFSYERSLISVINFVARL